MVTSQNSNQPSDPALSLNKFNISVGCFNESYRELENALSDDELPDMPSTPELDQELQELLELSFDTFHL